MTARIDTLRPDEPPTPPTGGGAKMPVPNGDYRGFAVLRPLPCDDAARAALRRYARQSPPCRMTSTEMTQLSDRATYRRPGYARWRHDPATIVPDLPGWSRGHDERRPLPEVA